MTALPADDRIRVPPELLPYPHWVCWQYATRDGKRTKLPIDPNTGALASATDASTWGTYDTASTALAWKHHSGLGFVFAPDDPFCFIDLDDAYDLDVTLPWAQAVVDRFPDAYWEVSVSGTGLHGIGRGVLPSGGNRKGGIELYDRSRFATFSGRALDGWEIGPDCTDALTAFHAELFAPVIEVATPVTPNPPTPPLTDDEVLERALGAKNGDKLRVLLAGDITGYPSQSEAEMATVGILKFWTQDATQIERILRLSGLQRDKWERNESYVARTITNALAQPHDRYEPPSNVVDFRTRLGQSESHDGTGGERETVPGVRLSDLGNGQRLAHRLQGKAHWCGPMKRWFVHDGQRWNSDALEYLMRWSKESVLAMYDAASALPDKARTDLLKHAMKSESERALKAGINLAASEDGIPILPEAFDTDPMLLNVENGTIDLTTGHLRPHDPKDLISKMAAVTFDPAAECPHWLAFLDQIFEGDAERIAYIQKAFGYSLSGKTSERIVLFLYGSGKNGKSTLVNVVATIMADYHHKTPVETIMAKRNDGGIPNDIAALKGARFVTASETEENRRLNVAKVKDMSGNEVLTARFLHGEFFNFRPQFKLWLSTNHKPIIPGNDRAMFDRCKLVPFDYRVPDDEIDPDIEQKLLAEAPGILNWLLAGCLAWQRDGLRAPDSVVEAIEQYRAEMDQVGVFIADRCVVGANYRATSAALYAAYKAWCEVNGERQQSATWFGRQLSEREFAQIQDGAKRTRVRVGIGLLDDNQGGEQVEPVQNRVSHIGVKIKPREGDNTGEPVQPVQPVQDDVEWF